MDKFDRRAPIYDRLVKPPSDSPRIHLLEWRPDSRLLDAAGGTDRASARRVDGQAYIFVLDRSLPMLRQGLPPADHGDNVWLLAENTATAQLLTTGIR